VAHPPRHAHAPGTDLTKLRFGPKTFRIDYHPRILGGTPKSNTKINTSIMYGQYNYILRCSNAK
jgi:hypothetical protein